MACREELQLEGEPFLEFLPAADVESGLLIGFEALVRWDHPSLGLVQPSVLLPLAEAGGWIDALNRWVVHSACAEARRWPEAVGISVNVSSGFRRPSNGEASAEELSDLVRRALEESGLEPWRLTVEVTERSVVHHGLEPELSRLSQLGVHVAVDDVGKSWSTLEKLPELSISTIKIDRDVVAQLEPFPGVHRAIAEAIIHVSHSLEITTVAEGVESAEQLIVLRELDADAAQGFFFAAPLAALAARAMAGEEPTRRFPIPTLAEAKSGPGNVI